MKRLFSLLLTLTALIASANAQNIKRPDFAYPKTVSANSIKSLNTSLQSDDVSATMRALIDYSIASQMIGAVNLPTVFAKIDSVKSVSDNIILRSLADLLEASIYNNVYTSNSWNYNRRKLPLTPLPADFNEWSGEQFRQRICRLLDSALIPQTILRDEKISRYNKIITQDSETRIYYPTLYDFAANLAINILESIDINQNRLIPYSFVATSQSPAAVLPPLGNNPTSEKILSLYTSLISVTTPYSAPSVNAMLGRMKYILDNTVNPVNGYSVDYLGAYVDFYRNLCDKTGKPKSEYAGDILIAAPRDTVLYSLCKQFLNTYPNYWRNNCIRNIISDLSVKSIDVSSPTLVPIGKETAFTVTMHNTKTGSIDIYDVSSLPVYKDEVNVKTGRPVPGKKIATLPLSISTTAFPFNEEISVKFTFPKSGNYIAVPRIEGVAAYNTIYTKIHASSVVINPSNFKNRIIWAVNPADGSPLENVNLSIVGNVYSTPVKIDNLGSTDKDGKLVVTSDKNGMVIASVGDDKYTVPVYSYNSYSRPDKWDTGIEGYTSLPLYHPGDTAEWCAVCYEYKAGLHRVLADREMKAVLYDASSMAIDTVIGVTDKYGRLSGSFILPKDGLSGRYNVRINERWTSISFEVSDYKLPTFMIQPENTEQGVPSKGDVTLRGSVMTYSGFPMSDTEVTLDLSVMNSPSWWRSSSPFKFYATSVTTDADGCFSIPISKEILALSPLTRGYYSAQFTATSATGESHTASLSFTLGERYIIKVSEPNNIDISCGEINLDVKVVDYRDSIVNIPVNLTLFHDGTKVKSLPITQPVNLSEVKPGKYIMAYSLGNAELADTVKRETILYNPKSSATPVPGTLFWTPDSRITIHGSDSGKMLYATDTDSHLLLSVTSGDSILYTRWENAPAGMHTLAVSLPDHLEEGTLNILCTGDYRQSTQSFKIVRDGIRNGIKFTAETFHDKINPGSEETWTFRVTSADGSGQSAAVIAELYNTALDALAQSDWSFRLPAAYTPSWDWGAMPLSHISTNILRERLKNLQCLYLKEPQFETYGKSLTPRPFGNGGLRIRGTGTMLNSKSVMSDTDELSNVKEHKEAVFVEEEAAVATAGMAMNFETAESADAGTSMLDESSAEEPSAATEDDSFSYRESEVPLAFFRPSLTTDNDGKLVLTFTVPNANTQWGFRAIAFTDSLVNTSFSTTVLASKPVMVQPNLPRFLRCGDKAVVFTSVMNNSDTEQEIRTVTEIFNPSDNSILDIRESTDTVLPGKSAIVRIEINTPDDMPFIGYRVKSTGGSYADGEQALIPVLPSVTPVIETEPFFLGPDEHKYETRLPSLPSGGKLTLSLCENPAWYVVTALPGLLDRDAQTASEAALSIYSASVANGLLRNHPSIAEALKSWMDSDKSAEILTSMLDRNEDLKLLLLNATPWMVDAKDDTERMTRLSLLFDKTLVQKTLSANISTLKSLEAKSGGWFWYKQYPKASRWTTREVLSLMGRLSELGFLPDDKSLAAMINRALEWDNTETSAEFSKYPDGDYTSYVRLHDMFTSSSMVKPVTRIVENTVQRIISSWKNADIYRKAIYAEILSRNSYPSVAHEILRSIREFAVEDQSNGMWFPSLDNTWLGGINKIGITAEILMCFHTVEPECRDINLLRQWLILQKGAQNWGEGMIASAAVAAILSTSDSWFVPASGVKISLGGKVIGSSPTERLLGEIQTVIPQSAYGKTLTIDKKGSTPSWGAVFSQYKGEMTEIKAKSCPELSIEKTVYQYGSEDNVSSVDEFSLGSKARVTLTLKANADMDYVAITDDRPACFEPVEQLPEPVYADGLCFYRENRNSDTRIFIDHLPKGTYVISYDMWVNNEGSFISGIAAVQSQYAPQYSAHSAGSVITVK